MSHPCVGELLDRILVKKAYCFGLLLSIGRCTQYPFARRCYSSQPVNIHRRPSMSSNKEMASFGPSSKVKSGAYHLRLLSVLGFAPTFLFLLLHGIFQHNLFPVLTIVPMSFSSLYSAALLLIKKKGGERRYALSGNVLIETACGCALIAFLVVDWVSLAAYWNDSGLVMLGTYGTVFPMMNL